jgi:UDP-hydrolysing UDP-N-acetyl-D-glucosamine 2-epimerase
VAWKFGLDPHSPVLLVIQHPVTGEHRDAAAQMTETMEAVSSLTMQTLVVFPNADAGGRAMISVIRSYEHLPFLRIRPSIPREEFLGLLSLASVLVGNSSAGIIEAPSLQVPAVNIGSRQEGRERGENILDVDYRRDAIQDAIRAALTDRAFRDRVAHGRSPYGDGRAAGRIVEILRSIDPATFPLQKRLTY